jgi:hypothetical protein
MVEIEGMMVVVWREIIDRAAKSVCNVGFTLLLTGLIFFSSIEPVQAMQIAPENQINRKPGVRFNQKDTGICRAEPGVD